MSGVIPLKVDNPTEGECAAVEGYALSWYVCEAAEWYALSLMMSGRSISNYIASCRRARSYRHTTSVSTTSTFTSHAQSIIHLLLQLLYTSTTHHMGRPSTGPLQRLTFPRCHFNRSYSIMHSAPGSSPFQDFNACISKNFSPAYPFNNLEFHDH